MCSVWKGALPYWGAVRTYWSVRLCKIVLYGSVKYHIHITKQQLYASTRTQTHIRWVTYSYSTRPGHYLSFGAFGGKFVIRPPWL